MKVIPKSKQLKVSPLWILTIPRIVIGAFAECDNRLRAFREWGSVITARQNVR